ncbi:MAG: helix-turn-helix domain-containing protein [Deltaproteobacteria bacterium]|nr:helix-turn-helix domain-containing protein [Deltaproteobacteria bacterium]
MTQAQLAKRASQNPRLIRRLESGEVDPRLSTLMKTAEGLECKLVVRFVPKQPVVKLLRQRAEKKAEQIVELSKGTAAMEEQEPKDVIVQFQKTAIAEELIDKKRSLLWED